MKKKKFTSTKPIKDKVAVDIINLLCEVFPNAKGIYVPPKKQIK